MTHRITFLLLFVTVISNLSFAQTVQPVAATVAAPLQHQHDVQVVLDWQVVVVSDEAVKSLAERSLLTLPKRLSLQNVDASSVLNEQQFRNLLWAADSDRGGNIRPARTLQLANETKVNAATVLPDFIDRANVETVQARVTDDQQAIEIRLEFEKVIGLEVKGTVPLGSHFVVHTFRLSERVESDSWMHWGLDKLFPNRKHEARFSEGFLVITPRIAASKPTG